MICEEDKLVTSCNQICRSFLVSRFIPLRPEAVWLALDSHPPRFARVFPPSGGTIGTFSLAGGLSAVSHLRSAAGGGGGGFPGADDDVPAEHDRFEGNGEVGLDPQAIERGDAAMKVGNRASAQLDCPLAEGH